MWVVNLLTLCVIKKLEPATSVPSPERCDIVWLKQLYWQCSLYPPTALRWAHSQMNLLYSSQHAFIVIMIINITAQIKLLKSKNLISMLIKFARIKIRPWVFGNLNHRHSKTSPLQYILWYNVFWNVRKPHYDIHKRITQLWLHETMRLVCTDVVHSLLVPKMYKSGNLIVFGLYFMWNNIMGGKFRNSVKLQSRIVDSKVRNKIVFTKSRYW